MVDPRTHQAHIGYAHTLAVNTTLSIDYTHTEGRHEKRPIELNPIISGTRLLANDFRRVYGIPNTLAMSESSRASTSRV